MDFNYEYSYAMEEGVGAVFGVIYVLYYLIAGAMALAGYILRASGTYTIAKRRGINNPWLAWIPVLDVWVLGSISDQFRYVTKGQIKNKRKILLTLNILSAVAGIALAGVSLVRVVSMAMNEQFYTMTEEVFVAEMAGLLLGVVVFALVIGCVALAAAVVRYMALYDLYTSVNPPCNVVFLVLSIIFGVTEPFFIFFNRKKDDGMPPRCDVAQEPVNYTEPSYIPPRPVLQEPWENPEE